MKHISTKFSLILAIFFLISIAINSQVPNFSFSKSSGGTLRDVSLALTTDSKGNIYLTGEFFSSSVNFGNGVVLTGAGTSGNCDFFLTKFDEFGNAIWAKKGGGTLTDRGYGLVIDSTGNLVVTGHYYGTATFDTVTRTSAGNLDVFTAKYDTSGRLLWFREGKDAVQSSARGIAYDNHGNTVVIGYYGSSSGPTITFDNVVLTTAGQRDIFLVKYNSDGVVQWAVSAGGLETGEEGKDVTCDAAGNSYVTGIFTDTTTIGSVTLNGNGLGEIFIAKYTPQGELAWARSAGGPKADAGYSISLDGKGNLYVGGNIDSVATFGSTTIFADSLADAFVAKYDTSGNFKWVIAVGGQDNDNCSRVIADAEGNCLAFGNFRSTASAGAKFGTAVLNATTTGLDDAFFMKISPTSEVLWVKQSGGDDVDRINATALNSKNNIIVSGYFKHYTKIGSDSLTSFGNEDIFLSQLGNNIVPVELAAFSANLLQGKILLNWSTATEKNNYGFEIQRSNDKITFVNIGFIPGNGTVTQKKDYSFSDANLNSEKYYYRLKQIDLDGTFTYSNVIEMSTQLPEKFELLQNYPNPFNPETNISFMLPADAKVTLSVFNVLGELVETLINKELNAGRHRVVFNAAKYVSGVFFYKINSFQNDGSNNSSVKKMIITK